MPVTSPERCLDCLMASSTRGSPQCPASRNPLRQPLPPTASSLQPRMARGPRKGAGSSAGPSNRPGAGCGRAPAAVDAGRARCAWPGVRATGEPSAGGRPRRTLASGPRGRGRRPSPPRRSRPSRAPEAADCHSSPLPECRAGHAAGCPVPGKFLFAGRGTTQ